jgi:hypothetical protein
VTFPPDGHGPYRLLRGVHARVVQSFDSACARPEETQATRLAAVLGQVTGTVVGRAHGLDPSMGLAAFRDAVPVRPHAGWSDWLDRVAAGEPGVMTRDPVRMLLETSGTTGRPKWLPVTDAWARSVGEAQSLWILGMLRDDGRLAGGRALSIVSPAVHGTSPGGLPVGANTGRMFLAQPWWVRLRAPVPYAVYGVADPDLRAYAILRHALAAPVRSWTTANPSTILAYCRHMARWWDALSADCAEGTLRHGPAAGLTASERRALGAWPGRFPRARLPSVPRPAAVWDLCRVSCWKGGSASFFLSRLPEALGADVPVREAGVNASEGSFAVPVDDDGPVAWLGGHLLEFLDDDGHARWAWEVEEGRTYRLVVTTEAGLLRYDMGDVVRVTGWCGRAPRLAFVRRAGNVLNATGEKLTEDQLVAAVRVAMPAVAGFVCSLGWAERPWVRVAVEGDVDVSRAAAVLDRALRDRNVEYDAKRETDRLGTPEVVRVPAGAFAAWKGARVRAGAPEAQVKDPVVWESPRWDAFVRGEES